SRPVSRRISHRSRGPPPAASRPTVETAGPTVREPELLEQHVQLLPIGWRKAVQDLRRALGVLQRLPAARASDQFLEGLIAAPVVRSGEDRGLERILHGSVAGR